MLNEIELPKEAYEMAKGRYEDLGEWFNREESTIKKFEPHIFSQGSFRIGTAVRPLHSEAPYDLDLGCKLTKGIGKQSHTQKQVKQIVGAELELYRQARRIKAPLEPMHRCWRMEYQDAMSFHEDVVPCIPENEDKRKIILESLKKSGFEDSAAGTAADKTVVITDDRNSNYHQIDDKWPISNPEGYAEWFEGRIRANRFFNNLLEKGKVDKIPFYRQKLPLQQAVLILKRHRDSMFADSDAAKPISIIITTLAARAYAGEQDVASCLENILMNMGRFVNKNGPRVPNPVDPAEDFADKWAKPECLHLNLEQNFWAWLEKAKADFKNILELEDIRLISAQVDRRFSISINESALAKSLGVSLVTQAAPPVRPVIVVDERSARPHGSVKK